MSKIEVKLLNKNMIFNVKTIKKVLKDTKISIIIRTKNEENKIEECIKKILQQKEIDDFEIIIIDSESDDKTVDLAQRYNVSIYSIPSNEFGFGKSIALGLELSNKKAEYCVFLSAHAIPKNDYWLINMINKFEDKVAAVYSKQTYFSNTLFIEKKSLDETFGNKNRIQAMKKKSKKFWDYKNEIVFSNASSCIKKTITKEIPFRDICASEDREWAYRTIKDGYKIVYAADSVVYHCHNESPKKYYNRIYINSKALYEFAGIKINFLEAILIFGINCIKNILYQKKNEKINLKLCIIYSYKYALAHYRATREKEEIK